MSKKVPANTIHCKFCNGTGRKKLSRKQQETADAFDGTPKTCNQVREILVKQGKLKDRKGNYDTSVHARVDRLAKDGVLRKVKQTEAGWTFVRV